ncbi:MAG: perosamine synthetase, partial [Betaproteobacteria bacterium]
MIRMPSVPAAPAARYWATMLPLLRPGMLLPGGEGMKAAFPFNDPRVQYVHFARNAIYFLVQHLGLVGTDVLAPAYFHGVELEALIAGGVAPRFYPVRAGMRVEPEDIKACLRPETRAVYLIHYLGFPTPVAAIQQLCHDRGIVLIEDCALALLSTIDGAPVGTFGDAAVFCLYKTLPTPDGGAVVLRHGHLELGGNPPKTLGTTRETVASMLRRFEIDGGGMERGFVRAVRVVGRAIAPPRQASWVDVGTQRFNIADTGLLMSRLSRTIIDAQDFDDIVATRRRNYLHLQSLLEDLSPPVFPTMPVGVCPLFYPFITPRKWELCRRLNESGIQAVPFWFHGEFSPPRGAFPEVDVLRDT